MNEEIRETIAKNKASRESHIQSQNAKKMPSNTQIIVHNAYQNTVQIAKVKQAKKCITNFAI